MSGTPTDDPAALRAEIDRLRELVGPSEQSYVDLRQELLAARDAVRGAQAELGGLRGQVAELHVGLVRAQQDQEHFQQIVYNTLRAFCDAGLMQEVMVDGSKSYFDTRTDDHPHFFWEDEARLTDAPADQLQIIGLPDAPAGAEIAKVDVVIRLRRC